MRAPTIVATALGIALTTAGAPAAPNPPNPPNPPSAPATTKAKDPASEALARLALSIQRATLANGLRVVLDPDPSAPTVAVSVTYDVGSRSEEPGKSGFAHLFEHMMFQGSAHVKKGDHFSLITERGGTLNGTTSTDRTNYFEVLPASELALALWLEADRMRSLEVNAENFENQRAVVKEEYRMRYENAAYARAWLRLSELVFVNYPPYANPTIGKMADLDAAKLEWAQEFYARHYVPNNAVVTIAGGFDPDEALALVERFFGTIPKRAVPPFSTPATLPAAVAARETLTDSNAKTPGLLYGYVVPPARTPEHYALELAAVLLGDGESARLYQSLVRKRALCLETRAWTRDFRGPDQFGVQVVLSEKAKLGDVERALDLELEALAKAPMSAAELERVKRRVRASFVFGLETTLRRAVELGEFEVYWGDARGIAAELDRYLAVTAAEVQAAVAKYLGKERRVVIEVHPAPKAPPSTATPAAPKTPASPAGKAQGGTP
jgi:predicted Zn-dependent peptidase